MRRRIAGATFFLALAWQPTVGSSQGADPSAADDPWVCGSDSARSFQTATYRHNVQMRRLGVMRGVRPNPRSEMFSWADPEEIVTALSRRYPTGTAALIYGTDRRRLCVWLIDAEGIRAYERVDVTSAAIGETMALLWRAFDLDSRRRGLVPYRRIGEDDAANDDRPVLWESVASRKDATIAKATRIFLPGSGGRSLSEYSRVVIVPTGWVGVVPFAVLKPFGTDEMLVDRLSYTVAASIGDIVSGPRQRSFRAYPVVTHTHYM